MKADGDLCDTWACTYAWPHVCNRAGQPQGRRRRDAHRLTRTRRRGGALPRGGPRADHASAVPPARRAVRRGAAAHRRARRTARDPPVHVHPDRGPPRRAGADPARGERGEPARGDGRPHGGRTRPRAEGHEGAAAGHRADPQQREPRSARSDPQRPRGLRARRRRTRGVTAADAGPLTARPLTARPLTARPLTARPLTARPLTARRLFVRPGAWSAVSPRSFAVHSIPGHGHAPEPYRTSDDPSRHTGAVRASSARRTVSSESGR